MKNLSKKVSEHDRFSEVKEKYIDGSKEHKKMVETEREKGERHCSPSRRTKEEANNGEAFLEAEVAGCSIFSMQQSVRERETEKGA